MTMTKAALVGLRDTLEHLIECQKQLEWLDDPSSSQIVTDAMLRDLERCRRLIDAVQRRNAARCAS